jgi:hypothetical protein
VRHRLLVLAAVGIIVGNDVLQFLEAEIGGVGIEIL